MRSSEAKTLNLRSKRCAGRRGSTDRRRPDTNGGSGGFPPRRGAWGSSVAKANRPSPPPGGTVHASPGDLDVRFRPVDSRQGIARSQGSRAGIVHFSAVFQVANRLSEGNSRPLRPAKRLPGCRGFGKTGTTCCEASSILSNLTAGTRRSVPPACALQRGDSHGDEALVPRATFCGILGNPLDRRGSVRDSGGGVRAIAVRFVPPQVCLFFLSPCVGECYDGSRES